MLAGFKIWYSDHVIQGTSYQDWVNAPENDIQLVLLYFKETDNNGVPLRQIANGNDYYVLNENLELTHSDDLNTVNGCIKYGKWTSEENIENIVKIASEDFAIGWLAPLPSTMKGDE